MPVPTPATEASPIPGIAGDRLNDGGTGLQLPTDLGFVDHGLGNAVLDRPGGVEVFQLGQDVGLQSCFLLNMGQLQQGYFADQLVDVRPEPAFQRS